MKVSNPEIKYVSQTIITWTFLNVSLNMIGLFITKLLNKAEFTFIDNIKNEFVIPLVFQSVLFGICLTAAIIWLKNKKYNEYLFVAVQFIMFHLIFFFNLKIHHGLHFESTFNNIGLRYLSNSGQYFVDILYLYFPINGNFENGLFRPDNLGTFYIHWILLNIVYYIALTWMSVKVASFFFDNSAEVKSIPKNEEVTEIQQ